MLTEFARANARNLLNWLARILSTLGISPNALTVTGFVAVVLISVIIAAGYEAVGGVLLILAAGFDAVDGSLARATGKTSNFGAFLDSTLDRWADAVLFIAVIYLGFQRGDSITILLAAIAMMGSFLVSYTRARAEGLGAFIKEGWFSRLERTVVLIAGLILTAWFGPPVLTAAVAIIALFANLTALQRILAARRALS